MKKALVRATVVLVPTYLTAYLTDKMIYVVPMLAAMGIVAASLFDEDAKKRIDSDEDGDTHEDSGYKEDGDSE